MRPRSHSKWMGLDLCSVQASRDSDPQSTGSVKYEDIFLSFFLSRMYACAVSVGACRSWRNQISLELKFQSVVSCLPWVLGIKPL